MAVALEHLVVQGGVNLHGIVEDEFASGLVVALRTYALYFGEELAEEVAQGIIIVDFDVGLAVALDKLDNVVLLAVLVCPAGDELAVAHVRLLDVLARLDAHQLGHQAVEHEFVVLRLVGFGVVEQA